MSLSAFYATNAERTQEEEVIVSERFKDDGKPVSWKLRSLTEKENEACKRAAMRQTKGKNGSVQNLDYHDYLAKLAAASTVFPNLKDSGLQDSYGVHGEENLLKIMLLPGEYTDLLTHVQRINGFDKEMQDMVDEVKN